MGKKDSGIKKFLFYLFRWQLSTPILWLVVRNLGTGIWSTILANLIGASIFFWVDKVIFKSRNIELWYLKSGRCHKCNHQGQLYRLVKANNYDRTQAKPIFLCGSCSQDKLKQLKIRGIKISTEKPQL